MEALYGDSNASEQLELINRNLIYLLQNNSKLQPNAVHFVLVILKIITVIIHRVDISYLMASNLLSSSRTHGSFSFGGLYAYHHTFRDLLQQFMPKTYTVLHSLGALDDKYLSMCFTALFVELLPPSTVYQILDAYLLEGKKILFRYALALVASYKVSALLPMPLGLSGSGRTPIFLCVCFVSPSPRCTNHEE